MGAEKFIWTHEELPQGSDAWKEWRQGLGGSDIACLMYATPWKTITELWEEKTGFRLREDAPNENMLQGERLEPVAKLDYERRYGSKLEPLCMIHADKPWMRTSLDGITEDRTIVVEIKCPKNKDNHERQTRNGRVPGWRYPQIQHELAVAMSHFPVVRADYYSYVEDAEPVCIPVYPDFAYIGALMNREEIFMGYVDRRERPPDDLFLPQRDGRLIARG